MFLLSLSFDVSIRKEDSLPLFSFELKWQQKDFGWHLVFSIWFLVTNQSSEKNIILAIHWGFYFSFFSFSSKSFKCTFRHSKKKESNLSPWKGVPLSYLMCIEWKLFLLVLLLVLLKFSWVQSCRKQILLKIIEF